MRDIPCSVGMLTFNSGKTLRRVLESVKDFDDIILCDGGSTDDTLALAKEYGARVIAQDAQFKTPGGNRLINGAGARNQMIDAAQHDWFLMLDSDESISSELAGDIRRIASAPLVAKDALAYRVPIRFYLDGRIVKHSSNYPGYQFRFFNKKSGGRYTRMVHNRIEFAPGTAFGTLTNPWFVYLDRSELFFLSAERGWYRSVEVKEAALRPLPDFIRYTVFWNLRASAALAVKSFYLYIRYGFRDTMPLQVEVGRTIGPLVLMAKAVWYRLTHSRA